MSTEATAYTIHAYTSDRLITDAEDGKLSVDESAEFRWFSNEFAETAALTGYREVRADADANPDDALAVALWRIELSRAEFDALLAEHDAAYDEDQDGPLFAVMDWLWWDRAMAHPDAVMVEGNDLARRKHAELAERAPGWFVRLAEKAEVHA